MLLSPGNRWVALLLATTLARPALAQIPPPREPDAEPSAWTLTEALARGHRQSPALRAARARLEGVRAGLEEARTYPHNPEIGLEAAARSGGGETTTDRGLELAQEIEIGGQRGRRIRAAEAALAAAEEELHRAERELANRVELAFAQGLAEERRVRIARSELALVESLLSFEERRLEAGAGTQIDLNLARAAAGRVRQQLQEALAARAVARTALAETVGVDPSDPPALEGPLPPPGELPALGELVGRAVELRADLRADRSGLEAARRRLVLERSLAVPNLRAGVFSRREEGQDVTGATVGIAIPLFDRNQGGIARAEAEVDRAAADLEATRLAVRRSVADAHARYQTAAEAVAALDALVVGTLEESLSLLERALEAGKVSAGDVLLLRRELVEAQRQHAQAELDLARARSDLRLAVGDPAVLSPSSAADSASGGR